MILKVSGKPDTTSPPTCPEFSPICDTSLLLSNIYTHEDRLCSTFAYTLQGATGLRWRQGRRVLSSSKKRRKEDRWQLPSLKIVSSQTLGGKVNILSSSGKWMDRGSHPWDLIPAPPTPCTCKLSFTAHRFLNNHKPNHTKKFLIS